ncbi:MAG: flagellin, partial [Planctomycetes bacterium]|nr:flagellin [Planctomycetota bacterium]
LMKSISLLNQASTRLSTMKRINRGSDDPAGLIAVGQLQAELESINAASDNAARAEAMIHTADSALGEISGLLNVVQGNVVSAAGGGLSDAEVTAMQIETDAALEAINRIGGYTSFGGQKLLDGSFTATFAFSPDLTDPATVEMPTISTTALGGASERLADLATGGSASLSSGNLEEAMSTLDAARQQVLTGRARLGAFEKLTIGSSRNLLDGMEENISAAISDIYDADVAEETSRLVQSQILVSAGISMLQIAGQRRSMIRDLFAGL